jgi:hypothetical protein
LKPPLKNRAVSICKVLVKKLSKKIGGGIKNEIFY